MSYIIDGDKLLRELSKERLIYPYNVIAEERVKEKLRSIIYSLPEESNEEMKKWKKTMKKQFIVKIANTGAHEKRVYRADANCVVCTLQERGFAVMPEKRRNKQ